MPDASPSPTDPPVGRDSAAHIFLVFLRLGLTSFGGPVAHIGFFRSEFVGRRRWLGEAHYADIVALGQLLPGPASSKVGIMLGVLRGGLPGALAAWLGFTLPSALALIAFGYGVGALGELGDAAWLHGLKIVAVAVVAQAVWSMARSLTPDRPRLAIAAAAAVLALAVPSSAGQVAAIVAGGLVGWRLLPGETVPLVPLPIRLSRSVSVGCLGLFVVLLLGLPILVAASDSRWLAVVEAFYRSGALVFGGGHVVLPLLQAATVAPGWVDESAFLAGYGAAQAVPGPLFTFAAYLGTVMELPFGAGVGGAGANGDPGGDSGGWAGGLLCLAAIFLPAFLLALGPLPFWDWIRRHPAMRAALKGVNAAVVGLLLAALYDPVWTSAIHGPADFAIALVALLLLTVWQVPPWLVVGLGAVAASAVALLA